MKTAVLLFFTVFLLKHDFARTEIVGAVVLPHGKQKLALHTSVVMNQIVGFKIDFTSLC